MRIIGRAGIRVNVGGERIGRCTAGPASMADRNAGGASQGMDVDKTDSETHATMTAHAEVRRRHP